MKYDSLEHDLNYEFKYNLEEKEKINRIINNESITLDNVRQIAMWKYNRTIDIEEELLVELSIVLNKKDIKIEDDDVRNILEELLKCKVVGYPLLSTILNFMKPDIFPIIDVRAYRALFVVKISKYTYNVYLKYCNYIYEIRDRLGIELSSVNEQLYMFDKK